MSRPAPTLMCVILPRGVRQTSRSSLPQLSAEGLAGGRWGGLGPATRGGPRLGESGHGSTAHGQSQHLLVHLRRGGKKERLKCKSCGLAFSIPLISTSPPNAYILITSSASLCSPLHCRMSPEPLQRCPSGSSGTLT